MNKKEVEYILEIFSIKYKNALSTMERDEQLNDNEGMYTTTLMNNMGDFAATVRKLTINENLQEQIR